MEVLKKEVRSLLVAAKEGLTPSELERDYVAMIGKPLPVHGLGFRSTLELVENMPEVVRVCPYEKGTFILRAIADENTKMIAQLVAKQRCAKSRKGAAGKAGAAHPPKNPQRVRAPILPATVKAQLQDLLSSSPLLLIDLEEAFFRRFGRAFQYKQYGFFSLFEVLKSVSDIVVVEQTRAGSLLTLKKCVSSEIEKGEMPQGGAREEAPRGAVWEEALQGEPQDLEPSLLAKLMAPEIPLDAVQDRSLCSLPPLERRCLVGVFVEFVVSPSQFYVRICSRENSDQLQDMMVEMRHCYSNKLVSDRYIMPESSIQPGQLCCVTVLKWWYRVIIHRVVSDQEVEVFYPDYGNLDIVRKSCLRFLKWCYLKLPAQAIPCSLAWVKPVEGTWSSAATLLFKKLCNSKLLVGIVDEYVNGILHLFLCDTSTKEDVYFHSVLRDGGCAEVCRENIPSQGFKELNPSALYIQPSGNQESDKLESLDEDSETASLKLDGDEPCDQQLHLPAEETQDDVLPLLEEMGVPGTTDQDPELAQEDTNEALTELMAVVKSVEDFDTSFIYSEQPAEMSRDDPDEEKMKSQELPGSLAVSPYSSAGLSDQGPSQKLYIPPTTLSTVLAAARLATSSHYLQWLPGLRKKV
ncbi:PREDICTED: tudor domain-containing protein 5 [Chaetura pelagica]|uniref:tudor domain-containing protein 5 n=1 Tax=Chaetura pelagica TaxID=8897 RepID=UPI0005233AF8|nr:PREDICTED: tudor domain-containing protein 5 [Chaetura pelagica]